MSCSSKLVEPKEEVIGISVPSVARRSEAQVSMDLLSASLVGVGKEVSLDWAPDLWALMLSPGR